MRDQSAELQDVKRQLTSVLRELSSAEEELLRLRQRKVDVSALETQVLSLNDKFKYSTSGFSVIVFCVPTLISRAHGGTQYQKVL